MINFILQDATGPKNGMRWVVMEGSQNMIDRWIAYGDASEGLIGLTRGQAKTLREALTLCTHRKVYRARVHRYEGVADAWLIRETK